MNLLKYSFFRLYKFNQNLTSFINFPVNAFLLFFQIGILAHNIFLIWILALYLLIKIRAKSLFLISIASLFFGIIFATSINSSIQHDLKTSLNELVDYEIKVIEPPSSGKFQTTFIVNIEGYYANALVSFPSELGIRYGDSIKLSGTIQELKPDLNSSYRSFLNSKNIWLEINPKVIYEVSSTKSILGIFAKLQNHLSSKVDRFTNTKTSPILNGILLGQKQFISETTEENLVRTGTSHIISASGFNVTIIYTLLLSFANYINRKKLYLISSVFIILYTLLIGIYILPAQRATIMILYILIGLYLGRKANAYTAILISTLLILCQYPFYWKNISFQLSIAATIGIFIVAPVFTKNIAIKFVPTSIIEVIGGTVAATIMTLPITFITFQSVSFISILANLLVAPLIPILMGLHAFGIFVSIFNIDLITKLIYMPINSLADVFLKIIEVCANTPISYFEGASVVLIWGIILIFIVLVIDYWKIKKDYETNSLSF